MYEIQWFTTLPVRILRHINNASYKSTGRVSKNVKMYPAREMVDLLTQLSVIITRTKIASIAMDISYHPQ